MSRIMLKRVPGLNLATKWCHAEVNRTAHLVTDKAALGKWGSREMCTGVRRCRFTHSKQSLHQLSYNLCTWHLHTSCLNRNWWKWRKLRGKGEFWILFAILLGGNMNVYIAEPLYHPVQHSWVSQMLWVRQAFFKTPHMESRPDLTMLTMKKLPHQLLYHVGTGLLPYRFWSRKTKHKWNIDNNKHK